MFNLSASLFILLFTTVAFARPMDPSYDVIQDISESNLISSGGDEHNTCGLKDYSVNNDRYYSEQAICSDNKFVTVVFSCSNGFSSFRMTTFICFSRDDLKQYADEQCLRSCEGLDQTL